MKAVSTWTIRAAWTGMVLGTVRARTDRQAAEAAARKITKLGIAPVEIEVSRQHADRRGMPITALMLESIHEAAHAVVARELGLQVHYVTVLDEQDDGGGGTCQVAAPAWLLRYLRPAHGRRVRTRGHVQRDPARLAQLRAYVVQSVAGRVAEELVVEVPPDKSDALGSDVHDELTCARLYGFTGKLAHAFVTAMRREAATILRKRWPETVATARELEARWVRRRIGPSDLDRIARTARRTKPRRLPALRPFDDG